MTDWQIMVGDVREQLAYCAGVIDSDGTIGIKKSTYSMRITKDCKQATYSERVCVKQVEPQAIELLHSLFGGYRFKENPSAKKGKMLHGWQVTDVKAASCLRAILPFLRIKKRQADNCLSLREVKERSKKCRVSFGRGHIGAASRPQELSDKMEALYLLAKVLNKTGVQIKKGGTDGVF